MTFDELVTELLSFFYDEDRHKFECTGFSEGMECCLLMPSTQSFLWKLIQRAIEKQRAGMMVRSEKEFRSRTVTKLELQAVHDTIVEGAYVLGFDEVVRTVLQVLGLRGPDEGTDKETPGGDDELAPDSRVGNESDAVSSPGDDHDGAEEEAGSEVGGISNMLRAPKRVGGLHDLTGLPALRDGDTLLVEWELVIE